MKRRITMARSNMDKLRNVWRDKNITTATKVRLVKTLIFPVFMYGAETWSIRERERQRIDAFEMWCWRRMLCIPWTARRTNVSILQELNVQRRLSATVRANILKFFGHITRSGEDSIERLVVQGHVEGRRPRGRSPTRWTDQIKSITGKSFQECTRAAMDRREWQRTVSMAGNN